MQQYDTPTPAEVQDQLARFCACVYDPDDLIEIRCLPSGRSTWHRASELPNLASQLIADNGHGEHIYIGVNPRVVVGDGCAASECNGDARCGRCNRCVQFARCLFVDLDKVSLDQARLRLRDSGLPAPTMIVASGGGFHFYWRLNDPLSDLDQWSRLQRGAIARFDADPKIHDAPRIMRAPGFLNHKYDPPRPCTIVEADSDRTYPLDEFAELEADGAQLEAAPAVRADSQLVEGERNDTLFRLGAGMRAKGFGEPAIAAALVAQNREQCNPPLSEDEVGRIAKSAVKYAPGSGGLVSSFPLRSRNEKQDIVLAVTSVAELLAEPVEETPWLVDGLLPQGGFSILAGKPKAGKSTLARCIALAVARGDPVLGRASSGGPVIYLGHEDKRSEVAAHFAAMGAGDDPVYVHTGPAPKAEIAVTQLEALIRKHGAVMAIIDTMLRFVWMWDVSDYAAATRALDPLLRISRSTGCHIMAVYHAGKADRNGLDSILGSVGIAGSCDTGMILKRRADGVRMLSAIQRYGTDLPETVVTMDAATRIITAAGTVADRSKRDAEAAIRDELRNGARTEQQIRDAVGGNTGQVGGVLRALLDSGAVRRIGKGVSGNPYRYGLADGALGNKA